AVRNFKRQCGALHTLGYIKIAAGDHAAGQAHAREVQRLAKISGDVHQETHGIHTEAFSLMSQGDYRECIALTMRGRTALSLCGLSHGNLDYVLMGIQAEVHKLKSEYAEAHGIRNQMLQRTAGDNYRQGLCLMNIAEINIMTGVPKLQIQKKIDASQAVLKADLNFREGDMSTTLFGKCLQRGWGKLSEAVGYCLERLADINRWEGSHSTSWPTVYLAHSLKTKEWLGIYKALQFLGDVFLREEDEVTATSLFTLALEGFTQMDIHRSRAECMIRTGAWEQAKPLFERSSQAERVQHINQRLTGIGEDVREQHKRSLARLTELNAPMGTVEELDEDLSQDELENEETPLAAV
ncbi:hypothetical protein B0H16DRAFT_1484110, partial [Mycena metata]